MTTARETERSTTERQRLICGTCGRARAAHDDSCSRHAYRPVDTDAHGRALAADEITLTEAELGRLPEYSHTGPRVVYLGRLLTGVVIGVRWRHNANIGSGQPPLWLVGEYVPGDEPETAKVRWYRVQIKPQ